MSEASDVVAAVDIGGTRIKAALVDASYETLAAITLPTPQTSPRTSARSCRRR